MMRKLWFPLFRRGNKERQMLRQRIIYYGQGENNRVTINLRSFIGGVFASANIPSFYRKEVVLWTIIKIYPIG